MAKSVAKFVKLTYQSISFSSLLDEVSWWYKVIWKWKGILKNRLFLSMDLANKVLTWDNLVKRGVIGPNVCVHFLHSEESVNHLFMHCSFVNMVWKGLKKY